MRQSIIVASRRKVQGEIVSMQKILEKHAGVVKNYGIFLRYLSRTETINMQKEFRDTSLSGAVSQIVGVVTL